MKTKVQQKAWEEILKITYPVGWDTSKENKAKVQKLYKIIDSEASKDTKKTRTKLQQQKLKERKRRDKAIVSLAEEGHSYVRIAELMACSPTTARKAVNDWRAGNG